MPIIPLDREPSHMSYSFCLRKMIAVSGLVFDLRLKHFYCLCRFKTCFIILGFRKEMYDVEWMSYFLKSDCFCKPFAFKIRPGVRYRGAISKTKRLLGCFARNFCPIEKTPSSFVHHKKLRMKKLFKNLTVEHVVYRVNMTKVSL